MSEDDERDSSMSAGKGSNSGYSSGAETDDFLGSFDCAEDELLYVSRHGKKTRLLSLLVNSEEADEGDKININCKGNQKCNRGWSPLHLAVYFGQTASVRILLEFGANVNQLNSAGESPLHLAAYTGREEIVGLLLQHGADTTLFNTAGQTAKSIARSEYIVSMIAAADSTATLRNGYNYQELAASGNAEALSALLSESKGLNINCEDHHGNTALHLAAMRDHCAVAVILLQHGINTQHKNHSGLTALDLAQSEKMKQVLAVQPIQTLYSQPQRFEGFLLKKSRFVGFKQMWVVLERGVLSYFLNRGDASTGSKRKGMKFLDEAQVLQPSENGGEIRIQYSDGIKHTLHAELGGGNNQMGVQKWLNALREHIAYSTHYIHKGEGIRDESDDDLMVSLGTMQDSLQNAQAHQGHLEKQVSSLVDSVAKMSNSQLRQTSLVPAGAELPNGRHHPQPPPASSSSSKKRDSIKSTKSNKSSSRKSSSALSTSPPASMPGMSAQGIRQGDLVMVVSQANDIVRSSREMCHALNHCMTLLSQQEELRQLQLKEQQERCRMLQDSLHVLATEHHELERTISRRPSVLSSMEDEFFDCDDEEVYSPAAGSPVTEEFVDAMSRDVAVNATSNHSNGEASSHYGRASLPVPMFSRSDFSLWSILKQCIGKELSKITMPVVFNEPLSFIQRLAEYMEYAPLIEKAAQCEDPVQRLEYISAFAVSALSSNWERIGKPFNPLLGETYELNRPDLGFRFIGEQVSHHPPVTAFYSEGSAYSFRGSIQPKLRFWGKSVEINPKGTITLELHKYKETYTWQNVNCCIHNIIVGQLWVEHSGTMEISCSRGSLKSVLHFKQSGWFSKDLHHVEGFIYDGKKKVRAFYGSWVLGMFSSSVDDYEAFMNEPDVKSKIMAKDKSDHHSKSSLLTYNYDLPSQKTLWTVNPRPPHSADYYHFSLFSMTLNELVQGIESLPPTDSRLRPDIRCMEEGKIDQSAEEKNRVEEKQREARKERKKSHKEWHNRWFSLQKSPTTGKEDWVFNPSYWNRDWKSCPDVF